MPGLAAMLFNSLSFLGWFAVVTVAYYAVPHRVRWGLLLVASLHFYATFDARYVILLCGVTAVTYAAGRMIAGSAGRMRRWVFAVSVVAVVGALLVFKYADFAVETVEALAAATGLAGALPRLPRLDLVVAVGLSFYTFSCVSYLADVHAGRLPAEAHVGRFAVYVAFFPKLLAGPIERARPFLDQARVPVAFQTAEVTAGLQLVLWGLFKKVVVADRLAQFVDGAYALPAFAGPADLVLATYFFAFQIYCDFSGYSDMAIGCAKVLGFDLAENFRRPYLARSVPEFWADRWHVSLASWFRDYVYIPLGGSRVAAWRRHRNVLVVFLVSGLWHGASWTFVAWGGLNGILQVVSIATRRARSHLAARSPFLPVVHVVWNRVATFHLILGTWVFFRAATWSDAMTVFTRVTAAAGDLPRLLAIRIANGEVILSLGLVASLLAVEVIDERRPVTERLSARPVALRWAAYYAVLALLVVLGVWDLQRFVYMQF